MKVVIGADVSQGVAGVNKFNQALAKVKPGAQSATFALTNLGRVAQDSSFGFIGIANNLNPLLESFQRLRVEAGSNVGALKLLGSSLMGAGGIGLALSAVTAILQFSEMGFRAWTGGTKKAKEESDEFAKSLKEVTDLQNEAVSSVQGQIATVNALAKVITDTNKPYAERKRALEELKETNKSYFGDLTLETSKLGILAARVKEYTQAIIQQAIVKKFADAIADTAKALSDQERQLQKSIDAVAKLGDEQDKIRKRPISATGGGTAKSSLELLSIQKKINAENEKIKVAKERITELDAQSIADTNELNKAVETGLKLKDLEVTKVKEIREHVEAIRHARIISPEDLRRANELSDIIKGILPQKTTAVTPTGPITPSIIFPGSDEEAAKAQKMLENLAKLQKASDILKAAIDQLGNSFVNLFDNLLQGGQNAFQSFASAIGAIIRRLIAAAAAAAVFAAIVTVATGGAGAGAFLSKFKSIFASLSGLPKFAQGGVVTKPTLGLFGEAGPEAVIPLNKLDQMGGGFPAFIELRLRGRDAVGLIDMNRRSLNRIT